MMCHKLPQWTRRMGLEIGCTDGLYAPPPQRSLAHWQNSMYVAPAWLHIAVRWVSLCSTANAMGMSLYLRSMKGHCLNSGLKAENLVHPFCFVPATRPTPLLLNPHSQTAVTLLWVAQWAIPLLAMKVLPGEGSASLILLGCQTGVQICVLLCKDRWCYSLGSSYPTGLCGSNSDAHRSLSVKLALESQWATYCMITFPCCTQ